jgi:hypothetical protein
LFNDFGQLLALVRAPIAEGRGLDREFGEFRPRPLRKHAAMRAFLLTRQLIEPHLQRPDSARNQSGMNAMGNLVRLQGLKDRLQIAIQSRLLAFDRMKPPAAEIVHERLNPADTSQRVETSFHRLAGNEPNAKGAHERFDRWLDGEVEQDQAACDDKRRGDEENLDLRG